MATQAKTLDTLKHVGGHPALDFVNTVSHWADIGPQRDYLGGYADLLRWSSDAGVLDTRETCTLSNAAIRNPDKAARVFREALALRHALHEVLQASIVERAANAGEARVFDGWYRRAARARAATFDRRGKLHVDWTFAPDDPPLELLLLEIAWSVAEFMLDVQPGRLKECPADQGCGWLFHDTSKNRSRRWCDMSDCGNTAKARRHYARVRKARKD